MSNYKPRIEQNNTELQSNNTDLQGLLDTINALPVAENLDEVLAQQETLIEDIKTALEGKAGEGTPEFGWFSSVLRTKESGYYKFPFLIGTTWEKWLSTPCNMDVRIYYHGINYDVGVIYASEGYVRLAHPSTANPLYVSIDGTDAGRVVLTDIILDGTLYGIYEVIDSNEPPD